MTGTVQADDGGDSFSSYIIDTFDESGDELDLILVPGSPPESSVPTIDLDNFGSSESTILPSVPAFDWCYGCSATSAAMLFGYYDNQGYDNMYVGPANDGVCPLTNSIWGSGECPLSATHEGYDGLADKGHVDDYWASTGSNNDPYYDNWDEHGYEDCTADFMGTNQYHNWNTSDGGTFFFFRGDGSPLYDYDICEPSFRDGSHGMRLFAESRGYSVDTNFSQYIEGLGSNPDNGFSFSDFQEEIDSGRPVIIQVAGHSMLGFGYSDPDTIFIHNTWDHNDHSMTWGGSYCGMQHYGVTVIRLEEAPEPPEPEPELSTVSTESAGSIEQNSATLSGILGSDGGESCQFRFEYDVDSAEPYDFNTGWAGSLSTGEDFSSIISGLEPDTTYYFRAQTKNSAGSSSGAELSFTSLPADLIPPEAPASFSAVASGIEQIDLSWTRASGANQTKVQRKQGSFPMDKDDGIEVYFSNGESFSDTGLSPENTYYYHAWSFSQDSQLWSIDNSEAQATTEPLANIPPYKPTSPSPETLSSNVSIEVNLSWIGGDPDSGDTMVYDVYLDAVDAGTLIAANQSSTTFNPGELQNNVTYYWKVIATDSDGESTASPVWEFTTEAVEKIPVSYNISLSAGWNLISLPIIPDSNNITRIITPDNLSSGDISNINIIYSFNISSSKWIFWNGSPSSTITSINDGQGYWLFAEAEDTLTIWGTEATATDYSMTETWNMLGFTSIAEQDYASYLSSIGGSYSMLYGWDAATESWFCPTLNQHGGKLEPGHGYWIYMSSPATIMLS